MTNLTPEEIRASAPVAFVELAKAGVTAIAMPGASWEDLSGEGVEFACKLVRETLARAARGDQVDREEIAYWRRDLSARLWMNTSLLKSAMGTGDDNTASVLAVRLRAELRSLQDAESGEWHDRCEVCGDFVLPGEPTAAGDDVSGHARCLIEGEQDAKRGEDTTDADLSAAAAEALKTIETYLREPPAPVLSMMCPVCLTTGSMTPSRGHDNNKDTCTKCGGEGMVDPKTGQTPETSFRPEVIHVPV